VIRPLQMQQPNARIQFSSSRPLPTRRKMRPPVPTMTSVVSQPELTQVSTNKSSGVGQDERSLKV
jgi:hypothetical protein